MSLCEQSGRAIKANRPETRRERELQRGRSRVSDNSDVPSYIPGQ